MDERTEERIGAASGIAMVIIGAVAELFERAPETAADFVTHRAAVLTQGMVFLLGSAVALWFLAALRGYLLRYEGGGGRLSSLVLAAGVAWVSVNLIAQAFQIGLADDPSGGAPFALIRIAMAINRQTRRGVMTRFRPTWACRPSGPPVRSAARRTVGSVQVGKTRSAGLSDAARGVPSSPSSGPDASASSGVAVTPRCYWSGLPASLVR